MVLVRTLILTALGMLGGLAASVWASRFIASLLFGVPPRSPVTIAGAGIVLAAVAVTASAIPAFHAARSDPARALRDT
jgi:ABC-type antimicrobial peptide transport system permease subunit